MKIISPFCVPAGFSRWSRRWLAVVFCLTGLACSTARADVVGLSQTLSLTPGWNAVYLEIDPSVTDPAALFAGTPVDIVATFTPASRGQQFVRNPSAAMLSAYGWAVWYAPTRSDGFLSSLYGVYGGKAYLIHARTNASVTVTGSVGVGATAWTPNAYNFVGFALASPGAPTFQQFFRGSPAHNHNQIYRLVNGTWRKVLNPATEAMRAGEAFWIFCRGRSDFQGPLEVSTTLRNALNLTSRAGGQVVFRNRTDHPVSFLLEHITDPARPVPLSTPVKTLDEESGAIRTVSVHFDAGHFQQAFPPLEAGRAIRLPLALRTQEAAPGGLYSLLKVTTDLGTIAYIPVTATRDE